MIIERAGDFRYEDLLTSEHLIKVKDTIIELCLELRDEIIPLTEAIHPNFDDIQSDLKYPDFY